MSDFLFILFGIGTILSHYSTAYISIFLFMSIYFLYRFTYLLAKSKLIRTYIIRFSLDYKPIINLKHILILMGTLIIWNMFITHTSGNFTKVISEIYNDYATSSFNTRSSDLSYSLFKPEVISDKQLLNLYYKQIDETTQRSTNLSSFYSEDLISKYPLVIKKSETLPLTSIGKIINNSILSVFTLQSLIRIGIAKALQILLIIGVLIIFFRKKRNFPFILILLNLVGLFLILLMIILPRVSVEYGVLRMFQQLLFVFSIAIVIGLTRLLKLIKLKSELIVGFIAVFILLHLSGALTNLTGGYYPQLNTNNGGIYFDAFYPHQTDKASVDWLKTRINSKELVQSDSYSGNKLQLLGSIFSYPDIIPRAVQKNSYVFLDYTNVKKSIVVNIDQTVLLLQYPSIFLDDNKNLIYNNGFSKIYK